MKIIKCGKVNACGGMLRYSLYISAGSYGISAKFESPRDSDFSNAPNITAVRSTAEKYFNLIVKGKVFPCHLKDVIRDLNYLKRMK